jgi:hypothetical protein
MERNFSKQYIQPGLFRKKITSTAAITKTSWLVTEVAYLSSIWTSHSWDHFHTVSWHCSCMLYSLF